MTAVGTPLAEHPVTGGSVPRFDIEEWAASYGVVAGITGRGDGLDMGLFGSGQAGHVAGNWLAFCQAMSPEFHGIAVARQIHGKAVQLHTGAAQGWQVADATDGHLTLAQGLLLSVTVADCIPIYLVHGSSGAVGLLHAGWRGIAAGILEAGLDLMSRRLGAPLTEVVIHCGVGICGSCYEVGSEVVMAVTGRDSSGPEHLDLRQALAERASRAGVSQVTVSPWCSAHDRPQFFSHRRSGGSDGRMVAYIGRPRRQP